MSEYWLQDGELVFADGDSGVDVMNHEMHVLRYLTDKLVDDLYSSSNRCLHTLANCLEGIDCDPAAMREQVADWADQMNREGELSEDEADDCYSYIASAIGWDYSLLADTMSDDSDLRNYGIESLGWIRIAGSNVETQTLNRSILDSICGAFREILMDDLSGEFITIEVKSTRKLFRDIPITVAEDGMSSIQMYSTAY